MAVIGGGPAGTSAAFHAAKLGLKTIIFEKRSYPREKPCGGALSARCIPLLGKHAVNAVNCKIDELRLFAPSFKGFTCKDVPGYFVTRQEFDRAMANDARDAGAQLMEGCKVTAVNLLPSGDYEIVTGDDSIISTYVILAAGLQDNTLAKQLGIAEKREKDYLAMCLVSETPIRNDILKAVGFSERILAIFLGAVPNGYGWYFVKDGYVNIGIGSTALLLRKIGAPNAYKQFVNDLKEKGLLPGDLQLAKERPFPLPFKRTAKETVFGRVLLAGDSAGFVSPVTGEGLYYGIKGGQLAAEAIFQHLKSKAPLTSYRDNWKKAFGNDLNTYGYFLQKKVYANKRRMEFVVSLGRHDRKMAGILTRMIYGIYNYKRSIRKILARVPVSLFKLFF